MLAAIASIAIAGVSVASVSADTKTLQCDSAKNCKVVFIRPRGNIEVTISNSGGGGSGSTVDQTARDGVNELKGKDVTQDSKIDAVQAENQGLKQNVSDLSTQLNNANTEISSLQTDINTMKAQIVNISNANPVIDVNVTNGNTTTPVPPADNGTGTGTGTNGTNTGGGNTTEPVQCQPGFHEENGACVEDAVTPPVNTTSTNTTTVETNTTTTETNSTE